MEKLKEVIDYNFVTIIEKTKSYIKKYKNDEKKLVEIYSMLETIFNEKIIDQIFMDLPHDKKTIIEKEKLDTKYGKVVIEIEEAKEDIKTEENKMEEMFDKQDSDEMIKLFKLSYMDKEDCDKIYFYLKKYIRPKAAMYSRSCSCKTDISAYFIELRDWYSENASRFKE